MARVVIGVDPGWSGALAVMTRDRKILELHDCPPDVEGVGELVRVVLAHQKSVASVVVEQVGVRPGEHMGTTGKFMVNFGSWLGAFCAMGHPPERPVPQVWQRWVLPAGGTTKDRSLDAARKLCAKDPTILSMLRFKKDHNRADAIMLAEYGWRVLDSCK